MFMLLLEFSRTKYKDYDFTTKENIEKFEKLKEEQFNIVSKDVLDSLGDNNRFVPVLECNGIGTSDDCQLIVGDDQIGLNWKKMGDSSVSLKESRRR